jgi:hypothetical protein
MNITNRDPDLVLATALLGTCSRDKKRPTPSSGAGSIDYSAAIFAAAPPSPFSTAAPKSG